MNVIPDWSTAIQIVNFVLLIFIMNALLYKPIRNILQKREEKVGGLEQDIEAFSEEASKKDDAFQSGIKEARKKGLVEKQEIISAASEEEKGIIAEINANAQSNMAQVREKIKQDAEQVRTALQKEVDQFASAIGEKILGRAM